MSAPIAATAAVPFIAEISTRALRMVTTATNNAGTAPTPLSALERFESAAAEMAHWFARHAIESEAQGRPGEGIIDDMVDDWCSSSRWPRDWPQPGPVPALDLPVCPESADPDLIRAGRIIGALVLAEIGFGLPAGELGTAMLRGAERLSRAALAR